MTTTIYIGHEFVSVSNALAELFMSLATIFCDNLDDPWYSNLATRWKEEIANAPPGMMDLGLDDILRTKADIDRLDVILGKMERFLNGFDGAIPIRIAKAIAPVRTQVADCPTAPMLDLINKIRNLINNK